jgi:hypothetical protein
MKKIVFLLFLLPTLCFAQKNNVSLSDNILWKELISKTDISSYEKVLFDPSAPDSSVKNYYLKITELQNPGSDIRLQTRAESMLGIHLFYRQYYRNVPVYGGYIKVNVSKAGEQLSSYIHLYPSSGWNMPAHSGSPAKGEAIFVVQQNMLVPAYRKNINSYETVYDTNGNILFSEDQRRYFAADDTTIYARVFRPDPLTTAGVSYGDSGTYENFNDSDYTLLNSQRQQVSFPGTFRNDSFRLENQYAVSMDLQPPSAPPTILPGNDFSSLRSTSTFKETMAMYHIYTLQQYLQSIGFTNIPGYRLKVDAESGTADQSYFNPNDSSLNLGIGGVPDAEDADVITHEYTHSITQAINTNGISSTERHAIDEGTSDIMATTHSRSFSTFRWRWVFNWDGHNQYWNGRNADVNTTDTDQVGDYYIDSQIWSSTIDDIVEITGRDVAIRLLLNAVYSFTPNTTMKEAAALYMQADSMLYNKAHWWKIGPVFTQRAMLDYPLGISTVAPSANFKLYNSLGFAAGTGDLTIETDMPSKLTIYNLKGQKVLELKQVSSSTTLSPASFESGFYILSVENSQGISTSKLIRF